MSTPVLFDAARPEGPGPDRGSARSSARVLVARARRLRAGPAAAATGSWTRSAGRCCSTRTAACPQALGQALAAAPCRSPPSAWCSRRSLGLLLAVGPALRPPGRADRRSPRSSSSSARSRCWWSSSRCTSCCRSSAIRLSAFAALTVGLVLYNIGRAGGDLPGRHPLGRPRPARGGVRDRAAQVAGHAAGAAAPGGPADAAGAHRPARRAAEGQLARLHHRVLRAAPAGAQPGGVLHPALRQRVHVPALRRGRADLHHHQRAAVPAGQVRRAPHPPQHEDGRTRRTTELSADMPSTPAERGPPADPRAPSRRAAGTPASARRHSAHHGDDARRRAAPLPPSPGQQRPRAARLPAHSARPACPARRHGRGTSPSSSAPRDGSPPSRRRAACRDGASAAAPRRTSRAGPAAACRRRRGRVGALVPTSVRRPDRRRRQIFVSQLRAPPPTSPPPPVPTRRSSARRSRRPGTAVPLPRRAALPRRQRGRRDLPRPGERPRTGPAGFDRRSAAGWHRPAAAPGWCRPERTRRGCAVDVAAWLPREPSTSTSDWLDRLCGTRCSAADRRHGSDSRSAGSPQAAALARRRLRP